MRNFKLILARLDLLDPQKLLILVPFIFCLGCEGTVMIRDKAFENYPKLNRSETLLKLADKGWRPLRFCDGFQSATNATEELCVYKELESDGKSYLYEGRITQVNKTEIFVELRNSKIGPVGPFSKRSTHSKALYDELRSAVTSSGDSHQE